MGLSEIRGQEQAYPAVHGEHAGGAKGRGREPVTFNCSRAQAELERDRPHVLYAGKGDKPVPTIGKAHRMWFEPWMDRRVAEGRAKPNTREAYATCWRNVVEPRRGSVPVGSVEPANVQQWLLTLSVGNAQHAIHLTQGSGLRRPVRPRGGQQVPPSL